VVKEHLDIDGTVAAILRMRLQHPQATVVIEEAANGSAAIMHLQHVRGIGNVVAVKPLGGKMSRFQAMCTEWAAHDWLVPRNLLWVEPFLAQLMSFPAAKNDDIADACSQAASWLLQANLQYGAIYYAFSGKEIPGCYR
jgi:predicted phage terminase large subunit-like protein